MSFVPRSLANCVHRLWFPVHLTSVESLFALTLLRGAPAARAHVGDDVRRNRREARRLAEAGIDDQCLPRHQTHYEPSLLDLNDILRRGENYPPVPRLRDHQHIRYMWVPHTEVVVVVGSNPLPEGQPPPEVGPGTYCLPRHRMPFNSRSEGLNRVG